MPKAITYIDLFSGIGGFREGLSRAGGFVCVGHCEIDKYAGQSYRALFDTKGEWFREDVRETDPDEMPDFDLLCGGFPCQSFSIAGHRGGFADPRGTLFFEIARLTAAKRPAYVDDMGQLGVEWDNGSALSLIPGEDSFSKVSAPEKEKQKRSRDLER